MGWRMEKPRDVFDDGLGRVLIGPRFWKIKNKPDGTTPLVSWVRFDSGNGPDRCTLRTHFLAILEQETDTI